MINKLHSKDLLQQNYEEYEDVFKTILRGVELKLKDTLKLTSMPTFKTRVKKFESYYRKVIRVKPQSLLEDSLPTLTDMLGIRVICAFLEDLATVERQIVENFKIKEIERKGAEQTFKEFGYESIHILIEIPEDLIPSKEKGIVLPPDLVCEIQIRTILQNAWAEVEHELVYKSEFSPFDLPLRRKLASMNASLTLADIVFQEIRDYQNKLNSELDCRRSSFYEKADEMSNELLLPKESKIVEKQYDNIAPSSPYVHGTIDDLILEAIHSHNNGNMQKAVQIYTRIIESKPEPNPIVLSVIYKHRGMAHFAMNNFDDALFDFKKSTEYDSNNFRSFYYIGIVYSVIGENAKALEVFDKSLEINQYQSHVYYRKALAWYALADYSNAMNCLNKAQKLGLKNEDCQRLQENLVKKLDMGM